MEINNQFIVKTKINYILYQSKNIYIKETTSSFHITATATLIPIQVHWLLLIHCTNIDIFLIQRHILTIRKHNSRIDYPVLFPLNCYNNCYKQLSNCYNSNNSGFILENHSTSMALTLSSFDLYLFFCWTA